MSHLDKFHADKLVMFSRRVLIKDAPVTLFSLTISNSSNVTKITCSRTNIKYEQKKKHRLEGFFSFCRYFRSSNGDTHVQSLSSRKRNMIEQLNLVPHWHMRQDKIHSSMNRINNTISKIYQIHKSQYRRCCLLHRRFIYVIFKTFHIGLYDSHLLEWKTWCKEFE